MREQTYQLNCIKRMKRIFSVVIMLTAFLTSISQPVYELRKGDPNGIGKWYMGRQIAHVMSHYGIQWLERSERQEEEDTEQLMKNLRLKPGMWIADIGAGSGYHSVRMAKRVGNNGKVFAVDVEQEMIRFMDERINKAKITNIKTVQSSEQDIPLEIGTIDIILMVDVYHEFSYPYEMGRSLHRILKSDGRVYLVEFRAEDASVPIKAVHKMSESQAVKEMKAAGFELETNIDNLPWQHCLVFRKKK